MTELSNLESFPGVLKIIGSIDFDEFLIRHLVWFPLVPTYGKHGA